MPELPELEAFKTYFDKTSIQQKIVDINVKDSKLIKLVDIKKEPKKNLTSFLNNLLVGKQFTKSERRGKYLIAYLSTLKEDVKIVNNSNNLIIVFHFGLTGYLAYGTDKTLDERDKKYAQFIITFKNNYKLLWVNARKFGKVYITHDISNIQSIKKLGPDALSITQEEFLNILEKNKKKNIKALLLDQEKIAGIGNNYSNEILFRAKVNPEKSVISLSSTNKKDIFKYIKKVLTDAIKLNPTGDNFAYPKDWILSHKKDLACPHNKKHTLVRKTIAGRTAIYCPEEQS